MLVRCARQGSGFLPEPPAARGAIHPCGSAAPRGPSAALQWMARRLRMRSIARSLARTIVTCTKSAPPSNLAPRRRRPKTTRRFSADYVFGAARPKCRQPRSGKQGGGTPTDYVFREAEGRQRRSIARALRVYGVAALGSGCIAETKSSRRRGADCVAFRGVLSVARDRELLHFAHSKSYRADVGPDVGLGAIRRRSSHIGHVRLAPAIGRVPISSECRSCPRRVVRLD